MKYTIKGLQRIADDHNRHNQGDNWDWFEVIYEEFINGNNIKRIFDCMSRKETLKVIDRCVNEHDSHWFDDSTLGDIYKVAITSLEERL